MAWFETDSIHLGWFDRDAVLQICKNHRYAVYGLACSVNKPDNSIPPCYFEDTFYIGQSTGLQFDKKTKTRPGYIFTNLTKRIIQHNVKLYNSNTQEKKYKLFHDRYNMKDNRELRIWYSLTVPKKMPDVEIKPYILTQESEYILLYSRKFERSVLSNLDHKTDSESIKVITDKNVKREKGTLSERVMTGNNLIGFLAQQQSTKTLNYRLTHHLIHVYWYL